MMKELIGKRVKVVYVDEGREIVFDGTVQKVEDNLVFLTNVRIRRRNWMDTNDQIINTASSALVRFDIYE